MLRKRISVHPSSAYGRHELLWRALSGVLPVQFVPCASLASANGDAVLMFGAAGDELFAGLNGTPCMVFPGDSTGPFGADGADIRFASSETLPEHFRGEVLPHQALTAGVPLLPPEGAEVLATMAGRCLWFRRQVDGSSVDFTAVPPPELGGETCLFEFFQEENFLGLLPLLHFLRSTMTAGFWQPPPPRACFMFDDPNLHWPRYGHVDFAALAEQGRELNYHVSFATIPLDAWFVSRSAAALFRQHPERLSLLVHGNNHLKRELALDYSPEEGLAMLAQALTRISALEERSGVEVSRVMAAPHGACREPVMRGMARLGFESACISHGSLKAHNDGEDWTGRMGLGLAEIVGRLPIIPRFNLPKSTRTRVLLTGFLAQPLILMGHHMDLADGHAYLERAAGWINRYSGVQWLDLKSIARSNFCLQQEGKDLRVISFTRRGRISIRDGVSALRIESPFPGAFDHEGDGWQISGPGGVVARVREDESVPVSPGAELEFVRLCADAVEPGRVRRPKANPWPLLRRQLTEGRDRVAPLLPRR